MMIYTLPLAKEVSRIPTLLHSCEFDIKCVWKYVHFIDHICTNVYHYYINMNYIKMQNCVDKILHIHSQYKWYNQGDSHQMKTHSWINCSHYWVECII